MIKSQDLSQKLTNHTSDISDYLKEDPDFHLAEDREFEQLHRILEEEGMELKNFVDLKYSRRPSLVDSYLESMQIPAIVTDKKNHFLGVMSEMPIESFGKEEKVYYTSDLRVSKKAGIRTRMNFRKMYVNVLRQINADCFTVVLKDNQKAINALTKNKNDLHYSSVYEYKSRSILVLPSLKLASVKTAGLEVENGRSVEFENSKKKNSPFSHSTCAEDDYFLIKREGKIVGSFSLSRPKNRSLRVEAKNGITRFWVGLANRLFSHNYEEKLPWLYMTSFYLNDDIDRADCVRLIVKSLYQRKFIRSGEIFLFCHDAKEALDLNLFSPEFNANGLLFRVSADSPNQKELKGPVYLNPICL